MAPLDEHTAYGSRVTALTDRPEVSEVGMPNGKLA